MSNNSIFQFKGYKIKKTTFEINDISDDELKIAIDLNGNIDKETSVFQLTFDVKIKNESNTIIINVIAIGDFLFPSDKSIEELSGYFYMNAPAILFPYIRAYVATLTNLSGIEPINLPTLNLTDSGKKLKEQMLGDK